MSALTDYVERENAFAALFGTRPLELQNPVDRQKIASRIDSALSPENLTCDGELSAAQVKTRYKALTKAAAELQKLDPSVTFYEFA
jgi:hypothetical protein